MFLDAASKRASKQTGKWKNLLYGFAHAVRNNEEEEKQEDHEKMKKRTRRRATRDRLPLPAENNPPQKLLIRQKPSTPPKKSEGVPKEKNI